jgi:hypothetical protein
VLSAKGDQFRISKDSQQKILEGENAGEVVDDDLGTWYRELFTPCVTAGLIKASDPTGYRIGQAFIKGSKHTPLNPEAVRDAMPILFDLLRKETEPGVRAVLGHFVLV